MPLFFKDAFTVWLESHGRTPELHQPHGWMGAPPVGWKLVIGKSAFVYRIPEESPEILRIVLFERIGERTGLRSPFADIVKFISLVKKSGIPVTTIQGHVEVLNGRPQDSLENQQLVAFYKRYLAANQLKVENGVEWVAGDLRTYVPPLGKGSRDADPA